MRCFSELVNDSTKEGRPEVKCIKCNREFKHETIERFLEEENEKESLDYFKSLWNPPKKGKFV
jgi:cobalamin biosynthesis protein CbiG